MSDEKDQKPDQRPVIASAFLVMRAGGGVNIQLNGPLSSAAVLSSYLDAYIKIELQKTLAEVLNDQKP